MRIFSAPSYLLCLMKLQSDVSYGPGENTAPTGESWTYLGGKRSDGRMSYILRMPYR